MAYFFKPINNYKNKLNKLITVGKGRWITIIVSWNKLSRWIQKSKDKNSRHFQL